MTQSSDPDLAGMIGLSVAANKPRFTDIQPEKLTAFLSRQADVEGNVTILQLQGGGDGAGASSGIVIFRMQTANEPPRDYVLRYAPINSEAIIIHPP